MATSRKEKKKTERMDRTKETVLKRGRFHPFTGHEGA